MKRKIIKTKCVKCLTCDQDMVGAMDECNKIVSKTEKQLAAAMRKKLVFGTVKGPDLSTLKGIDRADYPWWKSQVKKSKKEIKPMNNKQLWQRIDLKLQTDIQILVSAFGTEIGTDASKERFNKALVKYAIKIRQRFEKEHLKSLRALYKNIPSGEAAKAYFAMYIKFFQCE
jgi:hypothetical protein